MLYLYSIIFLGELVMAKKVNHELEPYYNKDSKVLILGSIPSVKSRELGFYYMHPQNRFWKTLSRVYEENIPITIDDKKKFLKRHKIALWDTIKSCHIKGSSDSSITNVKVNDINKILKETDVEKIFTTGRKSFDLYNKYCLAKTKKEARYLPSTSPLYCPKGIDDKLYNKYKIIKKITK